MTVRSPSLGALADSLRASCFVPTVRAGPPLIGLEAEALVVDARTRRPFPLQHPTSPRTTSAAVAALATKLGWQSRVSTKAGVPEFRLPDGARVTFEPGGQVEYSSAPHRSASTLVRAARELFQVISASLGEVGGALLFEGIDPHNPVESAPLQLRGDRYERMDRHFARRGAFGARMMRQTASLQVSLDWGEAAGRPTRWRLLNSLTPYLAAIFANSPRYAGAPTGCHSYRRVVWNRLDPLRTGIPFDGGDMEAAYLEFALRAPAILIPAGDRPCAPFARWMETGCLTITDWHAHLGTLFPEVRPRGYLEVRTVDALSPEWFAAPVAFLVGLAYDPVATDQALALLEPAGPDDLERAALEGVGEDGFGCVARQLWEIALAGCGRLGDQVFDPCDLATAAEFAARYTARGASPADDAVPARAVAVA